MSDHSPCPFCGGEVDPEGWLGTEEDPVTGNALRRGPECTGCGSTAPDMATWNQRVEFFAPDRQLMADLASERQKVAELLEAVRPFVEHKMGVPELDPQDWNRLVAAYDKARGHE